MYYVFYTHDSDLTSLDGASISSGNAYIVLKWYAQYIWTYMDFTIVFC